jgi:hypothetical protein
MFRDKWLPRPNVLKLVGIRGNSSRRWVSELIDPGTRSWKEDVVRDCCLLEDAEPILANKLLSRQCDDFVAWQPEANGIFTARSAYRLVLQPSLNVLSHGNQLFSNRRHRHMEHCLESASPSEALDFRLENDDIDACSSDWITSSYTVCGYYVRDMWMHAGGCASCTCHLHHGASSAARHEETLGSTTGECLFGYGQGIVRELTR